MRVPGELQTKARLLHNGQPRGRMVEQNAGQSAIKVEAGEECFHANDVRRIVIEYPGHCESFEVDALVGKNASSRALDGLDIRRGVAEFFVVAGRKINAQRRSERL